MQYVIGPRQNVLYNKGRMFYCNLATRHHKKGQVSIQSEQGMAKGTLDTNKPNLDWPYFSFYISNASPRKALCLVELISVSFFFNSLAFCTCTKSDAFEMKALYMHIVHHHPKLLKTFGTISVFRGQIRKGTYVFVGFRLISRWCMPRRHVCSALRAGRCTW